MYKKLLQLKTFLLVALLTMVGTGSAWASEDTYDFYTYGANSFAIDGSAIKDNAKTTTYFTFTTQQSDAGIALARNTGVYFGTARKPAGNVTITSAKEYAGYKVTSVKITATTNSSYSLSVSIGGSAYLYNSSSSVSLSSEANEYTFSGSQTGNVVINLTGTEKQAVIRKIVITYEESSGPTDLTTFAFSNTEPSVTLTKNGTKFDADYTQAVTVAPNDYDGTITYSIDYINSTLTDADAIINGETGEVTISKTTNVGGTLKVVASATATDKYNNPANATYTLTVNAADLTLGDPVFSLADGTAVYYGTTVSITANNAYSILYTLDGSDPDIDNDGPKEYTSPIYITEGVTIKAIAYNDDLDASNIVTATYTVKAPEKPQFSPAAGEVEKGTKVTITAADDVFIVYTTDGTEPTKDNGTYYEEPIEINSNITLKAIALDGGDNASEVVTAEYTIPTLALSYSTGFENSEGFTSANLYNQTKTQGNEGEQWYIFYGTASTNGFISGSQSLQMRWYSSAKTSIPYTYTTFQTENAKKISFLYKTPSTSYSLVLSYSTDGGTNWTELGSYSSTTAATGEATLTTAANAQFKFTCAGTAPSSGNISFFLDDVKIYTDTSAPISVNAPTFSPAQGDISYGTEVTMASTTKDATIYYSFGTELTKDNYSTVGTQGTSCSITSSGTLYAVAVKETYVSEVASATYNATISAPTLSISTGKVISGQVVTISSAEDADIFYSFGTELTKSNYATVGTQGNSFTITKDGTLYAIAKKNDILSEVSSATYELTVLTGEVFEKVTDASSLKLGDVVTFVNEDNECALGSMGTDVYGVVSVDITEKQYFTTANTPELLTLEEGYHSDYAPSDLTIWAFKKKSNGYYISAPGGSKNNKMQDSKDQSSETGASIVIGTDNNAIVTFYAVSPSESSARQTIRYNYNSGNERFSCYMASSVSPIQLYRRITTNTTVTIDNEHYATLYHANNLVVPEGVVAKAVKVSEEGVLTVTEVAEEGQVIPALTGVMLYAAESDNTAYTFTGTTAASVTVITEENNDLRGTLTETEVSEEGYVFFKLADDSEGKNLGFYYDSTDGKTISAKAGKAYLRVAEESAQNIRSFVLTDAITGIEGAEVTKPTAANIYDLQGRRVTAPAKGLYIVNGKKVIK